ncbi:MAG: pyridoxamine 5'-phosphate oxidase family protein [Eubacterium sp.]
MFREMRRKTQQLMEEETVEILKRGKTAVIGVSGDDGYPYTVPVNYVYDSGKIYFHCAKEGHKIDAIKRNNKISLCVIDKDDVCVERLTTYFSSAVIFGRARILENEDEIINAAEKLALKYNCNMETAHKEIESALKMLCCVEIEIEHLTGKECIELTRTRNRNAQD